MLLLRIAILLVLLLLFIQDIRSRAVYWVLFPVLIVLFFSARLYQNTLSAGDRQAVLINILFLAFQFVILSVYFSIKNKRPVNITKGLLGWGDVLFLLSIAFYLSTFNFLFFYVMSLIAVLCTWLILQVLSRRKIKHIPLAGLQAMIFAMFLSADWWFIHLDLTSDDWLLHLLNQWTT